MTAFYRVFLSSLQDMQWVPQALVIGPQGVLDVVNMTGTVVKPFAGLKDVGAQVHLQWVIYFPWVPDAGKFRGEVIYSIRPAVEQTHWPEPRSTTLAETISAIDAMLNSIFVAGGNRDALQALAEGSLCENGARCRANKPSILEQTMELILLIVVLVLLFGGGGGYWGYRRGYYGGGGHGLIWLLVVVVVLVALFGHHGLQI